MKNIKGLVEQVNKIQEQVNKIQEQVNKIQEQVNNFTESLKKLKETDAKKIPQQGEVIEIADISWIILDKKEHGYIALAEKKIDSRIFGDDNDWKESEIREYLNGEFAEMIEKKIGCSLPKFDRDLLSLDGQTEYGSCKDKVSLISVDEYRKYRRFIPNGKDGYWWTITPDSTKCNDNSICIRVVSPSGCVSNCNCSCDDGVRPFCIFPSSIFESEEK